MDKEIGGNLYGTRRRSRRLALFSCALIACASPLLAQTAKTELRIGVVTPRRAATPAEIATLDGIRLGIGEARQTAGLFGDAVEIYEAHGDAGGRGAVRAASLLSSARKVQILIGVAAADADSLSSFAEQHGLIFLNVASRSQALRAACRRNSFHVEASDVMYSNAGRLFAGAERGGSVELWNLRLERFGASQLNDRFRALAHKEMDGRSWAGWAAIKIASEAALRARSTEPSAIRAYLESATTQFDGHKGWPLSFRAGDHQLRQPLYMVVRSAAPRIVDIPDLRSISAASTDTAAMAALDKLSESASSRCSGSAR